MRLRGIMILSRSRGDLEDGQRQEQAREPSGGLLKGPDVVALGYLGRYCSNLRAIGSLKVVYMSSISDGEGQRRRHAARLE